MVWKMPMSVATMNVRLGISFAAWMICEVEPTRSASSITAAGDSGCTSTAASGFSAMT